jgi:hypothetical protein
MFPAASNARCHAVALRSVSCVQNQQGKGADCTHAYLWLSALQLASASWRVSSCPKITRQGITMLIHSLVLRTPLLCTKFLPAMAALTPLLRKLSTGGIL